MPKIHDPGNERPLTELWAVLSVDEDGNEGLCGGYVPGFGGTPFVTGDPEKLCWMRAQAMALAAHAAKTIRIVKFTAREIVETVQA